MTYYLGAFAAYFVASFLMGIVWVLGLFRSRYRTAAGPFAIEHPIFPIGFAGIALFATVVIAVFDFAYPQLGPGYGAAFQILLVMWAPHYVSVLGVAAKYDIADRTQWLLLEAGFNLANVAVLSAVLHFAYAWLK